MMIATDHLMFGEAAHSQIPTEQEPVWSRKTLILVTATLTGWLMLDVDTVSTIPRADYLSWYHYLDAMLLEQILETYFCYSLSLCSTVSCHRDVRLYCYLYALFRGRLGLQVDKYYQLLEIRRGKNPRCQNRPRLVLLGLFWHLGLSRVLFTINIMSSG